MLTCRNPAVRGHILQEAVELLELLRVELSKQVRFRKDVFISDGTRVSHGDRNMITISPVEWLLSCYHCGPRCAQQETLNIEVGIQRLQLIEAELVREQDAAERCVCRCSPMLWRIFIGCVKVAVPQRCVEKLFSHAVLAAHLRFHVLDSCQIITSCVSYDHR